MDKLDELKRKTTIQVKMNGYVSASTVLEMIYYIGDLKKKNEKLKEQKFRLFRALNEIADILCENYIECYEEIKKRTDVIYDINFEDESEV